MANGVGLRLQSLRGSRVRIPPSAPFHPSSIFYGFPADLVHDRVLSHHRVISERVPSRVTALRLPLLTTISVTMARGRVKSEMNNIKVKTAPRGPNPLKTNVKSSQPTKPIRSHNNTQVVYLIRHPKRSSTGSTTYPLPSTPIPWVLSPNSCGSFKWPGSFLRRSVSTPWGRLDRAAGPQGP